MSEGIQRPAWARRLDRVAVALFVGAWAIALGRFAPAFAGPASAGSALLGALGGYLLADLVSGVVHWIADRYFEPTTPLIGPLLILPFREHHADATEIARHDFFEVTGNNALVTLPLVLGLLLVPTASVAGAPLGAAALGLGLGLSAALFLTNQLHGWAHMQRPPTAIRRLQRWGWILSPERHARHHLAGHDRAYCVTSGWLNPVLDRGGVFPALERGIARLARRLGRSTGRGRARVGRDRARRTG